MCTLGVTSLMLVSQLSSTKVYAASSTADLSFLDNATPQSSASAPTQQTSKYKGVFVNDSNFEKIVDKVQQYKNRYFPTSPVDARVLTQLAKDRNFPIDLILVQGHLESHMCTAGRGRDTRNCHNIGNTDSGDNKATDCNDASSCLDDVMQGEDLFISLISQCYTKSDELPSIQGFIENDFRIQQLGHTCRDSKLGARYMTDTNAKSKYEMALGYVHSIFDNSDFTNGIIAVPSSAISTTDLSFLSDVNSSISQASNADLSFLDNTADLSFLSNASSKDYLVIDTSKPQVQDRNALADVVQRFKSDTIGKMNISAKGVSPEWNGQCVTYAIRFMQQALKLDTSIVGDAKDYYYNYENSAFLKKNFDLIKSSEIEKSGGFHAGDISVYDWQRMAQSKNYGHIDIVESTDGQGYSTLGSNIAPIYEKVVVSPEAYGIKDGKWQGLGRAWNSSDTLGVLRPKAFVIANALK